MSKVYRSNIFKILLIIAISFSLVIAAIFFEGFNKKTYSKVYNNSNIFKNTNFSEEEYLKEVDNYKDYLFNDNDLALTSDGRYSKDEILHMEDVRDIFVVAKRFALGTLFITLFLVLVMNKEELKKFFKLSFLIPFVPAIFMLPAIINFDKFWIFFHKLLFRNDLWLMDPDQSLMINLLPQDVFSSISLNTIKTFLIFSVLFIVGIYFLYKIRRREDGAK